jgi:hypothetical protein
LRLVISEAGDNDWAAVAEPPRARNQRTPADFKVQRIKPDRALARDSSYRPQFTNVPLQHAEIEVALSAQETEKLRRLAATGKFGNTEAEVLRYIFFTWWIAKFMRGPKHAAPV